jgi:hypothetical protein
MVLLMFVMISLMVCFKSAVNINNKRYKCDNLTSFKDKINNIEEYNEKKPISDEEKMNLEKILKENNFNMDSLICVNDLDTYMYEDGYMLKENKQTNDTFDGLLFFTYIVMLSLLISFIFGIILNGNYLYDTEMNMDIFFLWFVMFFCSVSIIYPWTLNTYPINNKKVNIITVLVSILLSSLLLSMLFIIYFLKDAFKLINY